MADTATALTAIVVSGVIGPGLGAWWMRERQRADHRHEARQELREVLDEGAHALGRAKRSFERVHLLIVEEAPCDSPEAGAAFVEWRGTMADVRYRTTESRSASALITPCAEHTLRAWRCWRN